MIFKIFGGIFLVATGLVALGAVLIPEWLIGLTACVGGIALMSGK